MSDKLIVGYGDQIAQMKKAMEDVDLHSCQDQDGVNYLEMAKAMWRAGFRYDKEARAQWLVVELRDRLSSERDQEVVGFFNELIGLAGLEAT